MRIPAAETTRGLDDVSQNGSGTIETSEISPGPVRPEASSAEVRVLIAANGAGISRGIRLVLEAAGQEVCSEVDGAELAVEAAVRDRPDICLLDLDLPGSLRAAEQICKTVPSTAVVILAEEVSDEDLFDALRVGASGFVFKNIQGGRLPHVLRGVLRGEAALPRELAGRVAQEFRDRARRRHVALTDMRGIDLTMREVEILAFLREGLTTRQVASRLGIAQVTVRRHIGEILKKLNVASRVEALALLERRSRT